MTLGLDLLVIIIGFMAALVGTVLLIRMFRSPEPEVEDSIPPPLPVPPSRQILSDRRPYIKINPNRQFSAHVPVEQAVPEPSHLGQDQLQTIAVSEAEDTLLDVGKTFPPTPSLRRAHISRNQPNLMRLTLEVNEELLIYEKISLGEWNELEVNYEPPIFRKQESYAPGTALIFHISGEELDTRTYQFFVHYQDSSGRAYRQEIGGMGEENPIVEGPVAIGNWQ